MGNLVVNNLRIANFERAKIWGAGGTINLHWRANELAGEVGEACNILKKIVREERGEVGSRSTKEAAIAELADVIICLDLLAMSYDLPETFHGHKENPLPEPLDLNAYGCWLSMACNLIVGGHFMQNIAPALNESIGVDYAIMPEEGFRGFLIDNIRNAIHVVNITAAKLGAPDMRQDVSKKFNATSHKNGLPIFLNLEDVLTTSEVRSYIPG